MTPREALYHLVMELGPVPQTLRDDNLSPKEIRLRDAVNTLAQLIAEHDQCEDNVEKSREELMAYYCCEASKH